MIYSVEESQLTIKSVKELYSKVTKCMGLTDNVQVDLTHVEYIDTAGIAMILALWQYAAACDVVCHFKVNEVVSSAVRSYQIELP